MNRNEPAPAVASLVAPVFESILDGPPPVTMIFWDGSRLAGRCCEHEIRVRSADVLRRMLWAPHELGFARSYVVGDLDTDGPLPEVLRAFYAAMPNDVRAAARSVPAVIRGARELGVLRGPLPPPSEEVVLRGHLHSLRRDRHAVGHHYDVGNDFYELLLGRSMTYSCARFVHDDASLEDAQWAKHELICRKLGLDEPSRGTQRPMRLLDVGCGWGAMVIHAATRYDVEAVGITISDEQARLAHTRVDEAGLTDRVEIRLQDYRHVDDGPYDAISSIGMAEHVGNRQIGAYFRSMAGQLRPGGRMLNHAIAAIGGSRMSRSSFVGRYVFPDGELLDLADTVTAMEAAGFEVRDVENLREHYARTIGRWLRNLDDHWDAVVALVGERRARVWKLYLSGSMNGFDDGGLQLQQTLGVIPTGDGCSHMPPTRSAWG